MSAPRLRGYIGDTSFWIAAFDRRDEPFHTRARDFLERLSGQTILLPWPITYELLRTRTVKNHRMLAEIDRFITRSRVERIDDSRYREICLRSTLSQASQGRRTISLVDMMVRAVLRDDQYDVTRFMTFNLRDFIDVCRDRRIIVWPAN